MRRLRAVTDVPRFSGRFARSTQFRQFVNDAALRVSATVDSRLRRAAPNWSAHRRADDLSARARPELEARAAGFASLTHALARRLRPGTMHSADRIVLFP